MKVYRITASQRGVSFKQNIKATDISDARNKFLNKNETYTAFWQEPEVKIEGIEVLK